MTHPASLCTESDGYVGRFAPSPTGKLHLGSLLAAVVSFLDARANQGRWLLRIEDLDPPRSEIGATEAIIKTLSHHGLVWDGSIVYQSERLHLYQNALDRLSTESLTFYCNCARKSYRSVYPGRCRGQVNEQPDSAIRIQVPATEVSFTDRVTGEFSQQLERDVGDFVVKRRDGLFAYQLAVVTDDAEMGITHVVRGDDLLDNTPRQLYLLDQLGHVRPSYLHHPTVLTKTGDKLSKQTHATPIDDHFAQQNLITVFDLLGLAQPAGARHWPVTEILRWGAAHWRPQWHQIDRYIGL